MQKPKLTLALKRSKYKLCPSYHQQSQTALLHGGHEAIVGKIPLASPNLNTPPPQNCRPDAQLSQFAALRLAANSRSPFADALCAFDPFCKIRVFTDATIDPKVLL